VNPRRFIKRVAAGARRRASWWGGRPGRNFVLVYHRVVTVPALDPLGLEVTADRFAAQLEYLARRYDIVRADQCRRLGPRPRLAVTLDDGYADNGAVAAPILRRLGLPATFFLTTDAFRHDGEFWWDRIGHLLLEGEDRAEPVSIRLGRRPLVVSLANRTERLDSLARLNRAFMRRDPSSIEAALDALASATGRALTGCARHRRLSTDEVRALANDPLFDIGSHTCSHPSLRALPFIEVRRQLVSSRRILKDVVGVAPRLFAFPFGAPAMVRRRHTVEVSRAGYEMAFLNVQGAADSASPLALPRISVGDWAPEQLDEVLGRWRR
jgi:peptidoglycan/xylan/chitin deacetylase (PgdA/CDA1 family)